MDVEELDACPKKSAAAELVVTEELAALAELSALAELFSLVEDLLVVVPPVELPEQPASAIRAAMRAPSAIAMIRLLLLVFN